MSPSADACATRGGLIGRKGNPIIAIKRNVHACCAPRRPCDCDFGRIGAAGKRTIPREGRSGLALPSDQDADLFARRRLVSSCSFKSGATVVAVLAFVA